MLIFHAYPVFCCKNCSPVHLVLKPIQRHRLRHRLLMLQPSVREHNIPLSPSLSLFWYVRSTTNNQGASHPPLTGKCVTRFLEEIERSLRKAQPPTVPAVATGTAPAAAAGTSSNAVNILLGKNGVLSQKRAGVSIGRCGCCFVICVATDDFGTSLSILKKSLQQRRGTLIT